MLPAASVAVAKSLVVLLAATATGTPTAPDAAAVVVATGLVVVSQIRPV